MAAPKGGAQPLYVVDGKEMTKMTINGKDGPMSIMADTIRTDQGGEQVIITAEKIPGQQEEMVGESGCGQVKWGAGDSNICQVLIFM